MSAMYHRVASLALLAGLLAAGCDRQRTAEPAALPVPPLVARCEPGVSGGRLAIPVEAAPRTFNPLFAADLASDAACRLLHGSLLKLDWVTLEVGPGLAEVWTVAPDEKTWTFKLRQGLRWSDGAPVTADDVVFTWVRLMYEPQFNPATYGVFRVGGKSFHVSKIDDRTVRVVTPEIFAPFLEYFGTVPILPRHILEKAADQKQFPAAYAAGTAPEKIVGCGPFRLKQSGPGQPTVLERNPHYWVVDARGRRLPYYDRVELTPVPTAPGGAEPAEPAIRSLFLQGACGVWDHVRPEDTGLVRQAVAGGQVQLCELEAATEREVFWFNQNTGRDAAGRPLVDPAKLKLFRDRKFRQAVSCAIDRDRIAREVYAGRARPAFSFVASDRNRWCNPGTPRFAYDPARARALLAETGLKPRDGDGMLEISDKRPLEIRFLYSAGNPRREKAAAIIRENLLALGINLRPEPVEFGDLLEKVNGTFAYESALMGLGGGGADPASQLNVLRSRDDLHQWFPRQVSPSTGWEARIDTLMNEQMTTLNFARRKAAFDEVQSILAEEVPLICTVTPSVYAAFRSGIGNVRPSAATPHRLTWNLEEMHGPAAANATAGTPPGPAAGATNTRR